MDRSALAALFGDDHGLIQQLLAEYRSCNTRIEEELRAALEQRAWDDVRHAAHKLAGSSRTVGARALAEIGSAVETAVLSNDLGRIESLTRAALDEVQRVSDYIGTFV